jgi:outer membrane protein assembly factor BamD
MLSSIFRRLAVVLAIFGLVLAAGCSSTPGKANDPDAELSKLYSEAKAELDNGAFDRAIKAMEKVEARATGTLLGQQAMLDLAYAQWRATERTAALATLDRFIKLHPSSPAFDYALYLRGLVNFNDNLGIFGNLAGQQLSERDQRASRDAYESFAQLVQRYPASTYSADARLRMDYIVNSLAAYEVHVARYYLRRGAYVAAANRAKQALTEFEQSPANEEALAIMVISYDRLGLKELRDAADRVLRRNFPQSRFLAGQEPGQVAERPWWKLW